MSKCKQNLRKLRKKRVKASNYCGGGPRGYKKLDPKITSAIIGES